MKIAWATMVILWIALTITAALILPDRIFSHMDLYGKMTNEQTKSSTLIIIFVLNLMTNLLQLFIYRIRPDSPAFAALNIPNRKYWTSDPARKLELQARLQKIAAAMGAYVNFLVASTLYMTIHYYYPELPCPRHWLMMLLWLLLSVAFLIYTIILLRKPSAKSSA